MRYSAIIGEGFYNIALSEKDLRRVDAHFIAAAHHRVLALDGGDTSSFHADLYWKHVEELLRIVHGGGFSQAQDPSHRLREKREMWAPERVTALDKSGQIREHDYILPDPDMFTYMPSDARYRHGDDHPYDLMLESELMPSLRQVLV